MKHTPGPWRIAPDQQSQGEHTAIVDEKDFIIALIPSAAWRGKRTADYADAKLIIAVHDLLEALEHVRDTPEFKDLYPGTRELVLQAIQKAAS